MIYLNSIVAGAFITFGLATSLLVTSLTNKVYGALFFCLGLLLVVWYSGHLFTSEIFKRYKHKNFLIIISKVWVGNLIGTTITGLLLSMVIHFPTENVEYLLHAKLDQEMLPMFVSAVFANVFVCFAAYEYMRNKNVVGIFIIIGSFVILGFQHSIANMALFSIARATDFGPMLMNLAVASLGNIVGGLLVAYYLELRGDYKPLHY